MSVDILIFAAIAIFLILRLRSVLGTRHGDEHTRPNPFAAPGAAAPQPAAPLPAPRGPFQPPADVDPAVAEGLTEIAQADPAFTAGDFLSGARAAFEMIVDAFSKGDRAALRPLVGIQLYDDFNDGITTREKAGHTSETVIHRIPAARITAAKLAGAMAYVTVAFDAEQTAVTRDRTGATVAGNPDAHATVTHVWTFSRDTRSDDPNWTLIETATAEA